MSDVPSLSDDELHHIWDFSIRLNNLPVFNTENGIETFVARDRVITLLSSLGLVNGLESLAPPSPHDFSNASRSVRELVPALPEGVPVASSKVQQILSGPHGDEHLSHEFKRFVAGLLKKAKAATGEHFRIEAGQHDKIKSLVRQLQEFVRTAASVGEKQREAAWADRFRDLIFNLKKLLSLIEPSQSVTRDAAKIAGLIAHPFRLEVESDYVRAGVCASANLSSIVTDWRRETGDRRWRVVEDATAINCHLDVILKTALGIALIGTPRKDETCEERDERTRELIRTLRATTEQLEKVTSKWGADKGRGSPDVNRNEIHPTDVHNLPLTTRTTATTRNSKWSKLRKHLSEAGVGSSISDQSWDAEELAKTYNTRFSVHVSKHGKATKRKVQQIIYEMTSRERPKANKPK